MSKPYDDWRAIHRQFRGTVAGWMRRCQDFDVASPITAMAMLHGLERKDYPPITDVVLMLDCVFIGWKDGNGGLDGHICHADGVEINVKVTPEMLAMVNAEGGAV